MASGKRLSNSDGIECPTKRGPILSREMRERIASTLEGKRGDQRMTRRYLDGYSRRSKISDTLSAGQPCAIKAYRKWADRIR